jgi:hypothetical protein
MQVALQAFSICFTSIYLCDELFIYWPNEQLYDIENIWVKESYERTVVTKAELNQQS